MTRIPLIGLGTWRLAGEECVKAILAAYEMGYRHIDMADVYMNHDAVGKALQKLPRNEIFLTTKIAAQDLSPEKVRAAIPRFLKELQTDYLDLLLLHWPHPDAHFDYSATFEEMLAWKKKGIVRAIGVSNFVRFQLEAIAPRYPILTNQFEMHPYLQRRELAACCKKLGIVITAYRPVAQGAFEKDPVLQEIGARHGKSASQTALRWLVQQGIVVIPKAANPKHLKANIEIFDFKLSPEEMRQIDALDRNQWFTNRDKFPTFPD